MNDPEHRLDKLALFVLAGLVVVVIGGVVLGVFFRLSVPDKGDVLLGSIVTGLILFLRDLVAAVRQSWAEVTQGKTMDTLAANPSSSSGPSGTADDPMHTKVDNPPDDPANVKEARK